MKIFVASSHDDRFQVARGVREIIENLNESVFVLRPFKDMFIGFTAHRSMTEREVAEKYRQYVR